MRFNRHLPLVGKHAFLSASKYHWINYSDEKLAESFFTAQEAQRGVELHALAAELIRHRVRLEDNTKTLNQYVNDAIGFGLSPEVTLVYSDNAFGTADAIGFNQDLLRISDLKTGVTKASMHQLEVYAAFFCFEYGYKPFEIEMELRIYQMDEVILHIPEIPDIVRIMDRIQAFDKIIQNLKGAA